MDVTRLRQALPVTRKVVYLNTGWSGPSPRAVTAQVKKWLDFEARQGPTTPRVLKAHHQAQDEARQAVARLIGASPEEITLVQNTTEGINIVLNGMTWHQGDEVVTTNLEHSSGIIPCYSLASLRRVRVRIVDLQGVDTPSQILERLRAAIGPPTRLLLLSHIMYLNGMCLPLRDIQAMARESNVKVLVDAAQSVGQMPLNMYDLGCDFYSLPGHKWLLGPDGTGALYMRRELIPQIRPSKVGHHAAASYDFYGNWKPDNESIKKFELTTTSSPLWAGLSAAIDFINEIGPEAIQERIRTLSGLAVAGLSSLPQVEVTSPQHPELASGLVAFSVQGAAPQQVVAHLWRKGRVVSRWVENPPGVRLSLHFFNTEEEVEAVMDCMRDLR